MVDIPDMLEKKYKKEALESLQHLQITNSRYMTKDDFKRFVNGLYKQAGIQQQQAKFSRSKMDELHAFTARYFQK